MRDIFFQLAFAGYVGAFFNLNPFIERDGYHMLVDCLREPGLRRRAQEQFARRLSGGGRSDRLAGARALLALRASAGRCSRRCFAIVMSLRYEPVMTALRAASGSSTRVLGTLWVAFFVPVFVVVGKPLVERVRGVRAWGHESWPRPRPTSPPS